MKTRRLGPFAVAEIGLGCMNLSHAYGVPPPAEAAERLLVEAVERGVALFDTAALYGFGQNERLVGHMLKAQRSKIVLATKWRHGRRGVCRRHASRDRRPPRGDPPELRRQPRAPRHRGDRPILSAPRRLGNKVPIEDSVGAMSQLVEEGKVRAIGLSEVSAATLRRAHAVHGISALQSEYSLWTRNPELGALEACRELGIAFVTFSPLGRGYLTGMLRDPSTFDAKDIRRPMPRFAPAKNLRLLNGLGAIAYKAGCTMPQLALAWLLRRGEHVIPIPGTTNVAHLLENLGAAGVSLAAEQMARLDTLINERTVIGARYAPATLLEIDTEDFG